VIDPARWRKVQDIFHLVLAEEEPAARESALVAACGNDAALRSEVEHLLRSHAAADAFLETPAAAGLRLADHVAADGAPAESVAAAYIGPYRIEREIGSGGMGTVYVGRRDDDGLDRAVALKVVRRGMDSEHVLGRFATERKILAGLEHPGIARLYDSGTTDDGRPYFVMEYVAGHSLLTYCEAHALAIDARLRLFQRVCAAVQYAHQNLVVHRDLKPSNILVTEAGEPRLLDFGIAKVLAPDADDAAEPTMAAVRLMTPEYASPEQVRGERVTTASDVYSLGAILYEVLSGQRPYRLRSRAQPDVERAVLEEDPDAPSASVKPEGAGVGGLPPGRLRDRLRGDLDAIVLKALEKDPQRRYATAAELADDIGRHLEGRPVRAQSDSAAYRAAKFVLRHKLPVAAAAIAVISLVAGLAAALWQARVARAERARAEQRFADVRALANSLAFEVHDAIQFLPGTTAARQLIVKRALEYVDRLAAENPRDLDLRRELAAAYYRLGDVQGNPIRPNLGDLEGALASYQKALALMEGVTSEDGNNPADIGRIGDIEFGIGALLRVRGDLAGARAAFTRAVERLEPLADGPSPPGDASGRLVASYQRLAEIANFSRKPNQALDVLSKALPHAEAMARRAPADAIARLNLSQIYREESDALQLLRMYPEALARIRASRAILESLIAEQPMNTQFTMGLLFALFGEGVLLEQTKDMSSAIAAYTTQLAAARQMTARDPNDRSGVFGVAVALRALGAAISRDGRPDQGLTLLEEGRSLLLTVLANDPANGFVLDNLGSMTGAIGEARLRSADAARRARACDTFTEARRYWATLESRNALAASSLPALRRVDSRLKECGTRTQR
jgi:non-specific serine/threonine protein kinase/serine/threonine-protein kinase